MQLLANQKNFLVLSICIPKRINRIISEVQLWKKISLLVLTLGKFLEAVGRGIGTGSIFCLSFSLSNRVHTMYSGILCIFMFIRRIVYFNLFWSRYQLTISKSTFFFLILWYSERNNNCLNSKQTRDTMSVMKFQEMIMIFWKNVIKCISCLNISAL